MRIALFGATGPTGAFIVEQAGQRGWQVVAFARGQDPVAGAETTISGDVFDVDRVTEGIRGCDAVVSVLGFRRHLRGPSSTDVYSRSARTFVQAMPAAGVPRLIYCTSAGVEPHDPGDLWVYDHVVRPFWLQPGYDDMAEAERIIRASELQWVLVRPGRLSEGPSDGHLEVSERFRPPHANSLPRADLAAFMLDQVTSEEWLGKTPTLGVPSK